MSTQCYLLMLLLLGLEGWSECRTLKGLDHDLKFKDEMSSFICKQLAVGRRERAFGGLIYRS